MGHIGLPQLLFIFLAVLIIWASITLLSCEPILWAAHTWSSLPCVRTVRIHRKKHDVCATQEGT